MSWGEEQKKEIDTPEMGCYICITDVQKLYRCAKTH